MPSVFLFATLDTKGREADFVRGLLTSYGVSVTLVDVGALGTPVVAADISRDRIFELAETTIEAVRKNADRGDAVTKAAAGAARLARDAYARGDLSGVLGLGGSAGTTIATTAMQALPLGVPKVMLSTLASGMVRQFVGDKDIFMLNSVVDIAGINRVSREVLSQAARAMAGLVQHPRPDPQQDDKPLVAATMFGVTTACVERARETLERAGCEVLVFHATGNGGQAMESLIGEGLIAGVLDVTTTELADEHVGGFLSAGPDRLTAAGKAGIPQVVSTGALDMANFYAPESVPAKFKDRLFYKHNANVTLMRTTPEENTRIGASIAHKLSAAKGPVAILLPARGVSAIDKEGQPFDDPVARKALHDAIRSGVHGIPVTELDLHINDPEFANAAANKLLELMRMNEQPAGGTS
ncbi:MAG: Tm-1-like ATP-binding domain-containing protein [Acidobacteriota bacterium]|nr:Tm-1-like ATP-binding domain-containing protein [Acidobacteriota bacterium]